MARQPVHQRALKWPDRAGTSPGPSIRSWELLRPVGKSRLSAIHERLPLSMVGRPVRPRITGSEKPSRAVVRPRFLTPARTTTALPGSPPLRCLDSHPSRKTASNRGPPPAPSLTSGRRMPLPASSTGAAPRKPILPKNVSASSHASRAVISPCSPAVLTGSAYPALAANTPDPASPPFRTPG